MKIKMKRLTILANDPSFTAWGWVVLDSRGVILDQGCIKTNLTDKKLRIRAGDDRVRRIIEINQVLLKAIDKYHVNYIVAELSHGSQNASGAITVGGTTAILQTMSDTMEIGIEWYSEEDCKKCALGKGTGTKKEMIDKMDGIYDVVWTKKKYKDEAIADALAVHYIASINSPALKLFKEC